MVVTISDAYCKRRWVQHEITNDNQEKTETRNPMFSYMIGQATQAASRTKYRMKFNMILH